MTAIERMYFPCCKMFRKLFAWENMESIMKIIKFSLGSPLLKSLKAKARMEPVDYQSIFPNSGKTTRIEELG